MSGTTTTTNHAVTYAAFIASTEYGSQIFNGQRGEYGIYKFADPHRQATYEHHETRYKKTLDLKNAYDKQELLRKMRADMKREYLTRKKQMKRLQMDAAVDFRNAESSIQEHYATEAADHCPYIHGVDINAPLVSQIQLPHDQILDLKKFDEDREFAKVFQIHADLLADQQESIRLCEQEEQHELLSGCKTLSGCGDMECIDCYCCCYSDDDQVSCGEAEEAAEAAEQSELCDCKTLSGCGDMECIFCYRFIHTQLDDSDYCGECCEAVAEQQRWIENTRDSDGETWDEEARADEAEHRREVALMAETNDDDMTYTCDDHPDVLQLEVVLVTEPKERVTVSAASSGGISAQKKAAAGAAKARQAKQELKKKAKFVPFKITMNTNRVHVCNEGSDVEEGEEEQTTTTLLYQGRAQVNLPKKNLQNVSLKGKKRHIAIWRRIETAEKHASARGTRIANIAQPKMWRDHQSDSD